MYSTFRYLGAAGLMIASTANAQAPEAALLNHTPAPRGIVRGFNYSGAWRGAGPAITVAGERALLGRTEHDAPSTETAGFQHVPVDGVRALLGQWPSAHDAYSDRAKQSSFRAEIRGATLARTSGDAEFGFVPSTSGSASRFTVSLGARGAGSTILFTGRSGAPLVPGRYRIADRGNGTDEVLALVVTGSPTNPTGVFRGRSGWLEVTTTSEGLLLGRFQLHGIGFLASEPQREDRGVEASGSFSAASL
jgi:hypothetical protein